MRILMAAAYIYDERWSEFTRNKTGFGMMVNTIFQSISKKEEVYLTTHALTRGHDKQILKHTLFQIIFYSKLKDWLQGISWFVRYKQSVWNRVKYFYYCVNKGYMRRTIQFLKPDIVHIHGIDCAAKTYIEVCEELKIPYLVTLHGLIGLNDSVNAAKWDKELEKQFLIEADKKCIPVTVISTGMKKRIEQNYLKHEASNITVITNGTNIPVKQQLLDKKEWNLRDKFHLAKDTKICFVIGSIYENKNQKQIVDAIGILPLNMRTKLVLFVCGKDILNGQLQEQIRKLGLEKQIFVLGFTKQHILSEMLEQADLNIVASFNEGFGMSVIESFFHGVPTVTFADLDAVPDLWNEETMLLAKSRSTEDLAEAIQVALIKEWDREFIKKKALDFSVEKMANKYQKYYIHSLADKRK